MKDYILTAAGGPVCQIGLSCRTGPSGYIGFCLESIPEILKRLQMWALYSLGFPPRLGGGGSWGISGGGGGGGDWLGWGNGGGG